MGARRFGVLPIKACNIMSFRIQIGLYLSVFIAHLFVHKASLHEMVCDVEIEALHLSICGSVFVTDMFEMQSVL